VPKAPQVSNTTSVGWHYNLLTSKW